MATRTNLFVLTCACWIGFFTPPVRADLPPGAYDELKKQATEVYQVQITEVRRTANQGPDMLGFICRARILTVERTATERKPGNEVRFESYYVLPQAWRTGFTGPQSPPLLKAGWQGRVYLNATADENLLEIAAYGKSFEPTAGSSSARPSGPSVGSSGPIVGSTGPSTGGSNRQPPTRSRRRR